MSYVMKFDILRTLYHRPTPSQTFREVVKEYQRVTGDSSERVVSETIKALTEQSAEKKRDTT